MRTWLKEDFWRQALTMCCSKNARIGMAERVSTCRKTNPLCCLNPWLKSVWDSAGILAVTLILRCCSSETMGITLILCFLWTNKPKIHQLSTQEMTGLETELVMTKLSQLSCLSYHLLCRFCGLQLPFIHLTNNSMMSRVRTADCSTKNRKKNSVSLIYLRTKMVSATGISCVP